MFQDWLWLAFQLSVYQLIGCWVLLPEVSCNHLIIWWLQKLLTFFFWIGQLKDTYRWGHILAILCSSHHTWVGRILPGVEDWRHVGVWRRAAQHRMNHHGCQWPQKPVKEKKTTKKIHCTDCTRFNGDVEKQMTQHLTCCKYWLMVMWAMTCTWANTGSSWKIREKLMLVSLALLSSS